MNVEQRLTIERRIVRKLIRTAKEHGWALTRIWDGEENQNPKTEQEAIDVVFSVDECRMVFRHPSFKSAHCAVIILGNDGWDCIADNSIGEGWDVVIDAIDRYTDQVAEMYC